MRAAPVRDTVRVAYDEDALWSVSSRGELTRLDPATGEEVATLGLGIKPSGLAVGEGSVWVTDRNSPTLLRIDPSVNEKVEPFELPTKGLGTHLTGEVAVGAGSVWVGHGGFNPGAFVERLDAETGRLQHRFSILGGDVDHLAFADGALWVASTPGELRKIDPRSDDVLFRRPLQAQLCCVAAGGGYAWAASNPEGKVWKVATNGSVLGTIELQSAVKSLTYADGALWAALGEEGTAVRIDPTTDETREYDLGHSVSSVDARAGLFVAGVRHRIEDVTGDLSGDVVWVGRKGNELFDSGAPTDPAFTFPTWDAPQEMFHYTTCARLLNYADVEGDAGRTLVPEVAARFPEVSDGGRKYTFTIREGFGFSPPSNEEVTAESFRRAAERGIKLTKLAGDELRPPLTNIVGAQEYYAGKTLHISGVSAREDELVFRFREPQPDLPWLVAAVSCAVPVDTPVVEGGLEKPVESAGPYYLAALTRLTRSPTAQPELRRVAAAAPRRDRHRAQRLSGRGCHTDRKRRRSTTSWNPRLRRCARTPPPRAPRATGTGSHPTTGSNSWPSTTTGRSSQTSGCAARSSSPWTVRHSQRRTQREGCQRRACSTRASSGSKTHRCTRFEANSAPHASSPSVARPTSWSTRGTIRATRTRSTRRCATSLPQSAST